MCKVVGITGGIGSGKTTVANVFQELGIPVYFADEEAKRLMHQPRIKDQLIKLLGEQAFEGDDLNRDYIRELIFRNDSLRFKINSIVHPEVAQAFENWVKSQNSPYVLKEAAIIYEAGLAEQYDMIIVVSAPEDVRIKRLLDRPGLTDAMIREIISKQWTDEAKIERSDFVIYNGDLKKLKGQVYSIHEQILEKLGVT